VGHLLAGAHDGLLQKLTDRAGVLPEPEPGFFSGQERVGEEDCVPFHLGVGLQLADLTGARDAGHLGD
jgi:hypothetical protein